MHSSYTAGVMGSTSRLPVPVRVGLVGAGHISQFHLAAVRRLRGVTVKGLFDLDPERAERLASRFGVAVAPTLASLLEKGVDVVHVLTPPESHAAIALECLRAGRHVLVEKPAATDVADVEVMARLADEKRLSLGICHSLLFDPQVRRALHDVARGKLGRLVSVDILRSSRYPSYTGGPPPPPYRRAGYPFRDMGIHCLYLIEAFLGRIRRVEGTWRSLGGDPNLAFDEWRATVECDGGIGQFQLSWNVQPLQNQIVLQGTKGVRRVDLFLLSHARRSALPVPKAVERVLNALTDSLEPLAYVPWNVTRFAVGRLRQYEGVQAFVEAFYEALAAGRRPPVTAWDALSVVRWTEEIACAAERDFDARLGKVTAGEGGRPVLVTGATGGLGQALLAGLKAEGIGPVRALVRRGPSWPGQDLELVAGNLGHAEAVDRAIQGSRWVFHLGAAMSGGPADHRCATVEGTRNVIAACKRHGVEKLIYVSSLSVLDWAGANASARLTEDSDLEPRPEERGAYTQAKLEAERLVSSAARDGLPAVILRPGQIFGGQIPVLTPAVARRIGRYHLVLGDGEVALPLVYVEDVVDALILAARGPLRHGEILHLVDEPTMTQNQVLAELCGKDARIIRVPRVLLMGMGWASEVLLGLAGRRSPFSAYRLRSALARRLFSSPKAADLLGWRPRVGIRDGLRRIGPRYAAERPTRPSSSRERRWPST
jgi:predicted dehydrogenase/nucleoside-diphosphate-sugar epimerase